MFKLQTKKLNHSFNQIDNYFHKNYKKKAHS